MSNGLKQIKKSMQTQEDARTPTGLLEAQGTGAKIPPKLEREIDVYTTSSMKLMHSKETQPAVLDMLKSGPIEQSIPATALQINGQLESQMKPSKDVVLASSVSLVSDLFELADAAGIAPMPPEEQIVEIYTATLQKYIHNGLKDKSIDPIELQKSVEGMMSEEQKSMGSEMANEGGLPNAPTTGMATDKLVSDTRDKERARYQSQQGLLKNQAQQAVPGNPQQGGI